MCRRRWSLEAQLQARQQTGTAVSGRLDRQGAGRTSIPPLQYTQTPVSTAANGSLSFAEERRLELYKREQEAIESSTSIKGASNSFGHENESGQQPAITDPLQSISAALLRARADQAAGVPQQQASRIARGL